MTNHYIVLGVAATASAKEIKAAYQKLSMKFHPDKNPGDIDKFFEERFKGVNAAYEVLSDTEKRGKFDIELREYHQWVAQKENRNRSVPNRRIRPTHAIYLITFDSSITDIIDPKVENFHQALRTDQAVLDWLCFLDNSYLILVNRNITSASVANFVSTHMPKKQHLVVEVNMNNLNGLLPQNYWNWMLKYRAPQTMPINK